MQRAPIYIYKYIPFIIPSNIDLYIVAMIIVPYYIEYAQSLILHYFPWGESSKYSRMLISSMVFFLILLSGVQHDFLNLCICCKESLIPPNRNVVCTVLRYLKTIRGSCLNPWELFESVGMMFRP